jgi:hypothetical protein
MSRFEYGIIFAVILISIGGCFFAKEQCLVKGQSFEGVEFSLVGGCMVKHNDRWIPLENIRGFDDN